MSAKKRTFEIDPDQLTKAVTDGDVFRSLPIGLRAWLAAVALRCIDEGITAESLAKVGRFSRTTAIRANGPWKDLVNALVRNSPNVTDRMAMPSITSEISVSARKQIRELEDSNRRLRKERDEAEAALAPIVQYAHDVTTELRNWREAEQQKLDDKVRPLRPVGEQDDRQEGDW